MSCGRTFAEVLLSMLNSKAASSADVPGAALAICSPSDSASLSPYVGLGQLGCGLLYQSRECCCAEAHPSEMNMDKSAADRCRKLPILPARLLSRPGWRGMRHVKIVRKSNEENTLHIRPRWSGEWCAC